MAHTDHSEKPKVSSTAALIFSLLIVGLIIATANFVKVMGGGHETDAAADAHAGTDATHTATSTHGSDTTHSATALHDSATAQHSDTAHVTNNDSVITDEPPMTPNVH